MTGQVQRTSIFRKQALQATVTRACPHCSAGNGPGMGSHLEPWLCHACGKERQADDVLGEIWYKVWRAPTFIEYIKRFFGLMKFE